MTLYRTPPPERKMWSPVGPDPQRETSRALKKPIKHTKQKEVKVSDLSRNQLGYQNTVYNNLILSTIYVNVHIYKYVYECISGKIWKIVWCPTSKATNKRLLPQEKLFSLQTVFHLLGRLGWSPLKTQSRLYLVIFDGKLQNFPRGSSRAMKGLNLKATQRPATASIRKRMATMMISTFSNSATTRVAKQFWLFSAHLGYTNKITNAQDLLQSSQLGAPTAASLFARRKRGLDPQNQRYATRFHSIPVIHPSTPSHVLCTEQRRPL